MEIESSSEKRYQTTRRHILEYRNFKIVFFFFNCATGRVWPCPFQHVTHLCRVSAVSLLLSFNLHAPLWQFPKLTFFPSLPSALRRTLGVRRLISSVVKIPSWLYFLNDVSVLYRPARCRVAISVLVGFWCACLFGVFLWKASHTTLRVLRNCSFLLIYIHWLFVYLASEYLVFYLYNKSPILEHQFTIYGLFDFVYCVYTLLWDEVSTTAGWSRSRGIVVQSSRPQISPVSY